MEDRIYFNIESRTEMVKLRRLRIREDERIEFENRDWMEVGLTDLGDELLIT